MRSFKPLVIVTLTAFVFFATACLGLIPSEQTIYDTADDEAPDNVGGGSVAIQLPFPDGSEWKCVQGYNGSYSHQGNSTRHDLDFDTSNFDDEEIYAPVGGKVRVHMESATTNYGYHVNIELGDGTYVVVAHLKEIFVSDGEEVAAGQLLGFEGCTGACTGDHVHLGRHQGDAGREAQYGTSIESYYHLADATAEEVFEDISDTSVICGLPSEGDAQDGHWYMSELAAPLWHPDGTLVMTRESPEVYLLEAGAKRWIRDEAIFWSHGFDFGDVAVISDDELDCYGRGEDIAEEGLIDAFTDEFGFRWLVVGARGDSNRYRQMLPTIVWEEVLDSWGLGYDAGNPPPSSDEYLAWPERSWSAAFRDGSIIKEESRSDAYFVTHGVAAPIVDWNTYLLLGYYNHEVIIVPDGAVREVQQDVGDCSLDLWCLTSIISTVCGGGFDLSDDGEWGGDPPPSDSGEAGDTGEEADDYGDTDEENPCEDSDDDGYCSEYSGGEDCDDRNSDINPEAYEICGNGVDEDCDGFDASCPDDGDTGEESDADTDADSDSDTDSDADADTGSSGYGIMTVTWETDFGYNSQSLTAIYEYAPSSAEFEGWAATTFTASSADEISFSFIVPEGQTVRYSVEAYSYGLYDWSCESTSMSESDDELKGTHTIEFAAPDGDNCELSPSMYHKTSGTADGCEAMTVAECD